MGFAALNAAAHQGEQSRVRETLEAQESRVANRYAAGLRLAEEGRRSDALVSPIIGVCFMSWFHPAGPTCHQDALPGELTQQCCT